MTPPKSATLVPTVTGWFTPPAVSSKSAAMTSSMVAAVFLVSIPRNQFMLRFRGVSPSPRPLVTSGTTVARPPVPVLVATPAPVRRNHVSMVKLWTPVAGASPKPTYWLVPLNVSEASEPGTRAATWAAGSIGMARSTQRAAIDRRGSRRGRMKFLLRETSRLSAPTFGRTAGPCGSAKRNPGARPPNHPIAVRLHEEVPHILQKV